MAYTFEPGKSYFVLTQAEYDEMVALIEEFELGYDLANDFTLADDGKYYIVVGSSALSADELTFMEDYGFSNPLVYTKSTQSTSFF